MSPLTPVQAALLRFIAEAGRAPTLREICTHFHWASTNSAHGHLKKLEAQRYLTREWATSRRQQRGVQLTPKGKAVLR